jgi:cytochrome c553
MRKVRLFLLVPLTACLLAGLNLFQAADDAKPKYSIEEIMEKAHKKRGDMPSLFKQVVGEKANDAQKKELLEYYVELEKNKPEKGDLGAWKKRTKAIVKAAKDVVNGKDGATKELAKATNCSKCHELHKED